MAVTSCTAICLFLPCILRDCGAKVRNFNETNKEITMFNRKKFPTLLCVNER